MELVLHKKRMGDQSSLPLQHMRTQKEGKQGKENVAKKTEIASTSILHFSLQNCQKYVYCSKHSIYVILLQQSTAAEGSCYCSVIAFLFDSIVVREHTPYNLNLKIYKAFFMVQNIVLSLCVLQALENNIYSIFVGHKVL